MLLSPEQALTAWPGPRGAAAGTPRFQEGGQGLTQTEPLGPAPAIRDARGGGGGGARGAGGFALGLPFASVFFF